MSAALLREAAEALRERAETVTPGPWRVAEEIDGVYAGQRTVVRAASGRRVVTVGQTRPHAREGEGNVAYIATMHPDVGLALAAQFDDMAECVEIMNDAAPRPLSEETLEANLATYLRTVDTARLILGRAS